MHTIAKHNKRQFAQEMEAIQIQNKHGITDTMHKLYSTRRYVSKC